MRIHPQFRRLTVEQRSLVAQVLRSQKSVPERAEIVEAGSPATLCTLYEGWAYRYILLPDGRRQIVDFLVPGDTVGLDGAILGHAGYSVAMLTSGVLCCFAQETLTTLLKANHEFGEHLLAMAAAEIRTLEQRVVALGRKSAIERIAHQFLDLYRRLEAIGKTVPGATSCPLPLTQRHIADATGLTPTHVNNTLQQLRSDGVLSLSGRLLTIHDLPRLQELASVTARAPETRLLL